MAQALGGASFWLAPVVARVLTVPGARSRPAPVALAEGRLRSRCPTIRRHLDVQQLEVERRGVGGGDEGFRSSLDGGVRRRGRDRTAHHEHRQGNSPASAEHPHVFLSPRDVAERTAGDRGPGEALLESCRYQNSGAWSSPGPHFLALIVGITTPREITGVSAPPPLCRLRCVVGRSPFDTHGGGGLQGDVGEGCSDDWDVGGRLVSTWTRTRLPAFPRPLESTVRRPLSSVELVPPPWRACPRPDRPPPPEPPPGRRARPGSGRGSRARPGRAPAAVGPRGGGRGPARQQPGPRPLTPSSLGLAGDGLEYLVEQLLDEVGLGGPGHDQQGDGGRAEQDERVTRPTPGPARRCGSGRRGRRWPVGRRWQWRAWCSLVAVPVVRGAAT